MLRKGGKHYESCHIQRSVKHGGGSVIVCGLRAMVHLFLLKELWTKNRILMLCPKTSSLS
ncbi:hypothetical protein BDF21DRAFT_424022 [Thamnidium elegans]|nr:hypothetical protein BDF21DRAFT_424022 [Thamnidium elegans]